MLWRYVPIQIQMWHFESRLQQKEERLKNLLDDNAGAQHLGSARALDVALRRSLTDLQKMGLACDEDTSEGKSPGCTYFLDGSAFVWKYLNGALRDLTAAHDAEDSAVVTDYWDKTKTVLGDFTSPRTYWWHRFFWGLRPPQQYPFYPHLFPYLDNRDDWRDTLLLKRYGHTASGINWLCMSTGMFFTISLALFLAGLYLEVMENRKDANSEPGG
jgi:hypothetical protein